jgi:predicted Zn-dependent peptidase
MVEYIPLFNNNSGLIYIPRTYLPISTFLVIYRVGSRDESKKEHGLSHFLEHMFFKGTSKRNKSDIISKEMDTLSAQYNAFTSQEYTGYFFKVKSENYAKCLAVWADMLTDPILNSKEMKKEKEVVIEELNKYKDDPGRHIQDLLNKCMFNGHPLEHDIGGDNSTIRKYTRTLVDKYYQSQYHLNNVLFCYNGDLTKNQIVKSINTSNFKKLSAGNRIRISNNPYQYPNRPRVFVENKPALKQIHLCISFPAPDRYDDERFIGDIVANILGGGMSSRLFAEVREKRGLVYNINAELQSYEDNGQFCILTATEPKNLKDVLRIVIQEIKKIRQKLVGTKEFKKNINNVTGQLVLANEDAFTLMMLYTCQYLFNDDEFYDINGMIEQYGQITRQDVKRFANKYLNLNNIHIIAMGNITQKEIENLL